MAYTVSLTAVAEADVHAALARIRAVAPLRAAPWLTGLFAAVRTLADMPTRCPVIPEAEEIGVPLRQLLYGKRRGIYRIIFDIQEISPEGSRVRVLRIWHGSRDALTVEDIDSLAEE